VLPDSVTIGFRYRPCKPLAIAPARMDSRHRHPIQPTLEHFTVSWRPRYRDAQLARYTEYDIHAHRNASHLR